VTADELARRVELALRSAPACQWGASIRTADGACVVEHAAQRVLSTASVGKTLLLIEVARRFELDPSLREKLVDRRSASPVADSGLWQHLHSARLPMADIAILTASVSDNWATNVLLGEVGLDDVRQLQHSLGLEQTTLLDLVRDERADPNPAQLSVGTASELSGLMARVHRGEVVSPGVSRTVAHWLSLNVDLSMVAAAFGHDPLAHSSGALSPVLFNKTGTDRGVRADTGMVSGPGGSLAYAIVANWRADDPQGAVAAAKAMHAVGVAIGGHLQLR
jgi:beta-lactamase class A